MEMDNPPEAASKEVVAKAFQWLQNQPQNIKDLAQTKDQLVALYLKHQRTSPQNDAPVSSKLFVSELKDLAKGIEAFENSGPPAHAPNENSAMGMAPPGTPGSAYTQEPSKKASVYRSKIMQPTKPASSTPMSLGHEVDPKTRQFLTEIRLRFNLSNDNEALRMLVAVGYEKLTKN